MADFSTEFLFSLTAELDKPLDLGQTPQGHRQIFHATGGTFDGPKVRGAVLPGGGDWLRIRSDGAAELDVRATLRTDEAELIYMSYRGIILASSEIWDQLASGIAVDPAAYYLRAAPMYETSSPRLTWLNQIVAVGIGTLEPNLAAVTYRVFVVR